MFFSGSAVWGHRGWPVRYPDNSEAGIRAAAGVAAGVEVDVRRTADGVLVLSHDPALAGLVVAEHTWSDMASRRVGGRRPCMLDAILDLAIPLDLEVKNDPAEPGYETDHRIARDVADRAREGDVVTSFWWPSMDAVRVSHPGVETGLLLFDVPWTHAVQHAVDGGHRVIAPHHATIDDGLVDAARREGLDVVAWTVNEAAEAIRLAHLGVGAIITDRPGELIAESPPTGKHDVDIR